MGIRLRVWFGSVEICIQISFILYVYFVYIRVLICTLYSFRIHVLSYCTCILKPIYYLLLLIYYNLNYLLPAWYGKPQSPFNSHVLINNNIQHNKQSKYSTHTFFPFHSIFQSLLLSHLLLKQV